MKINLFSDIMYIKRENKLFVKNIYASIIYYFIRSTKISPCIKKIVFVCTGNICRSAFAEYLMKAETKSKVLSIDSCGLEVELRTSSPVEAINAAKKFGLNLDCHLSKGWEACFLEDADLILAMEFWQYRKLIELFPHKKKHIKLLREFAPFPEYLLCNINDPFGQSDEIFEKCFKQIKRSIQAIKLRI